MKVDVKYRLPRIGTGVDDQTVAAFIDAGAFSQLGGYPGHNLGRGASFNNSAKNTVHKLLPSLWLLADTLFVDGCSQLIYGTGRFFIPWQY